MHHLARTKQRKRSSRPTYTTSSHIAPDGAMYLGTPFLDVLVINVHDLVQKKRRTRILHDIELLCRRGRRRRFLRGTWLLLMTHSKVERAIAHVIAFHQPCWCQGIRVVDGSSEHETARAALDFHRLHFPSVPEVERSTNILVYGSIKQQQLLEQLVHTSHPSSHRRQARIREVIP